MSVQPEIIKTLYHFNFIFIKCDNLHMYAYMRYIFSNFQVILFHTVCLFTKTLS